MQLCLLLTLRPVRGCTHLCPVATSWWPERAPLLPRPLWAPGLGSSSSLYPATLGLTTRHCEVLGASLVRPSPAPCFFSQHHASLGAGPRHAQISRAEGVHARLGPSLLPAVPSWPGCPPGRCLVMPSPTGSFLPTSPGSHAYSDSRTRPKGGRSKTPVYFLGRGVWGLGSSHHSLVFTPRASGHHFQKSTFQKSSQQG